MCILQRLGSIEFLFSLVIGFFFWDRNGHLFLDQLLDLISAHLLQIFFGMRMLDRINNIINLRLRQTLFGGFFSQVRVRGHLSVRITFRWRQSRSTDDILVVRGNIVLRKSAVNTLSCHGLGKFFSLPFLLQNLHVPANFRFDIVIKLFWGNSSDLVLNRILLYILNRIPKHHGSF